MDWFLYIWWKITFKLGYSLHTSEFSLLSVSIKGTFICHLQCQCSSHRPFLACQVVCSYEPSFIISCTTCIVKQSWWHPKMLTEMLTLSTLKSNFLFSNNFFSNICCFMSKKKNCTNLIISMLHQNSWLTWIWFTKISPIHNLKRFYSSLEHLLWN